MEPAFGAPGQVVCAATVIGPSSRYVPFPTLSSFGKLIWVKKINLGWDRLGGGVPRQESSIGTEANQEFLSR